MTVTVTQTHSQESHDLWLRHTVLPWPTESFTSTTTVPEST